MPYETLNHETRGGVTILTLNRPKAMNALNAQMIEELGAAAAKFDGDAAQGCMIVTGSSEVFAAGADIKEMVDREFFDMVQQDFLAPLDAFAAVQKPVVAAVSGYALGGGCELAMMCDFIIATETAKFGQPEINLGVMPGAGGSQRLTRFVGKAKAMEMCLTGRMMDAEEAERSGLVSRIVDVDDLMEETLKVAEKIDSLSRPAVMLTKQAVNRSFETTLAEGILMERRAFQSLFATEDQTEGMTAFAEKRSPQFRNR
jgi:enoyl-CoA hydratase